MSLSSASKSPETKLIVISAPSGAGKSTLCEMLIRDFPRIGKSISCASRPPRPNETDGVHYYFLSKEEFQKRIDRDEFAEWAEVHGELKGTPKSEIDRLLKAGKHVLLPIDVQGAMSLQKLYGKRVVLIFIHPPSMEELKQRLVNRKGDSRRSIETRLQNAYNELEWSKKFQYQIINDDLNRAYQQLKEIIAKECL